MPSGSGAPGAAPDSKRAAVTPAVPVHAATPPPVAATASSPPVAPASSTYAGDQPDASLACASISPWKLVRFSSQTTVATPASSTPSRNEPYLAVAVAAGSAASVAGADQPEPIR